MTNNTKVSSCSQDNDTCQFFSSAQNFYPVSMDMVNFFQGHGDELLFYLYVAIRAREQPGFIIRKKDIIENVLHVGDHKWRKIIEFLKKADLLEQKYNRANGKIIGSQYHLKDFYKSGSKTSNDASNGDHTEALKINVPETRLPEALKINESIYKGGNAKGGEGVDHTDGQMIPFNPSADASAHKKAFLDLFPGVQTFQTFDDKQTKKRELNKIFHEHDWLNFEALNDKGAGVFLTINETDGKGREAKNITKVRAVYADLDGAPLAPVLDYLPHLVVESSPDHYHAYWLTDDVPLDEFRSLQKSVINQFGSDKVVHDLPHVMRVPGYRWNKEKPGSGFMTKIIFTSTRADKFSFDELKQMFPTLPTTARPTATTGTTPLKINGACKGERNDTLCRLLGGIAKRGGGMDQMTAAAYEFAAKCTPKLSRRAVQTTLAGARKWIEQ